MNSSKTGMNRREMLRTLTWSGGALLGLGALAPRLARAQLAPPVEPTGSLYIETYPTSPFILEPFKDEVPIPAPLKPLSLDELYNSAGGNRWTTMPGKYNQNCYGEAHQIWPSMTAAGLYLPQPLIYDLKLSVGEHSFTSSKVRPIDANGDPVTPPEGAPVQPDSDGICTLPTNTIYGFNGNRRAWDGGSSFPGAMIYARYGQPALIRFSNHLDNPSNPLNNLDRGDFGDPDCKFLTHLHNGHTAPESDGNPNHLEGGYHPGEWCDNLYLNYPAGGDPREMQSFMWFHDHTHGHTGANVFKGMVGLYPIYDPKNDPGDERKGYGLPGVPKRLGNKPNGPINYDERIEYDIPLALYDLRLDDGVTQHKDAHGGSGEYRPEWWGKTFFKHFPNHGFVGDVFTVNCKAYPVLRVKRRRYRLRFLDASIARCYELRLMRGSVEPVPGQQGQYNMKRIVDGAGNVSLDAEQCMVFTQVATEGGLLPYPIVRDSFEIWPANRKEVIVDFSKYMDGSPTTGGEEMYLVNTMKMVNGRKPNNSPNHTVHHPDGTTTVEPDPDFDPSYAVPLMKIIIESDTPPDNSIDPLDYTNLVNGKATLRMVTDPKTLLPVPALELRPLPALPLSFKGVLTREFVLERSGTYGGEIEWLINGHAFDRADANGMYPQAIVKQGVPELWVIRNGGGGWTHPMHMHQEEHRVISRNGVPTGSPDSDPRHIDDHGRFDVVNLDPSEEVVIYRNFRSFTGKYVAHCHNLAHEDHAMMFGWEISDSSTVQS